MHGDAMIEARCGNMIAREFHMRGNPKDAEPRLRKLTSDAKAPATVRDQAYYDLVSLMLEQRRFDETLKTIVSWGRYAELFAYDEQSETFSLENPH